LGECGMAVAAPLALRAGDGARLRALMRSSSAPAGLVARARMVLLAAEGVPNAEIARRVGVAGQTMISWRARHEQRGLEGLADEPHSGLPRTVDHRAIVAATLKLPRTYLGVTHWSSRLLARKLKLGDATVARAWREYGVQPLAGRDVQVLHRSGAGHQGHRRGGSVPGAAAERGGVVRGWTTTPPTSTRGSSSGSLRTRGSACTTRRHRRPG
jgi:transposase